MSTASNIAYDRNNDFYKLLNVTSTADESELKK